MTISFSPRLAAALLAALPMLAPAVAQRVPQAVYPLLTDQLDATANYGPIALLGNPTPPNPPANGVCVNGTYQASPNGQDVRTPVISTLNTSDFEFGVEFSLAALPAGVAPVLMGGNSFRWLGIYVQSSGILGLKHNNANLIWSTTTVATGTWYSATVKYENGNVELYLDGLPVLQQTIGVLNTSTNLNFTTNDFSNGRSHNGCIRNLVIANDTTLGPSAGAFPYGAGCDGLALAGNGVPTIGNPTFELVVSNLPASSPPLAFLGFGALVLNPGSDLTAIGMPGCFAYTGLDLGLYGPAAAIGAAAAFPLPIPASPSLAGVTVSAQGIAFSTATALGLASSNGISLVIAP
ncbi:MAG: LamG domain-containing protein [Planctomycetes bacterium]|jgi:hypothetical protein|nr:LamG domain-containing protein [Planctomycetota bacterium]